MTSVLTSKWVIDGQGNWVQVPMILTRSNGGWTERSPTPSDRAVEPRKAA